MKGIGLPTLEELEELERRGEIERKKPEPEPEPVIVGVSIHIDSDEEDNGTDDDIEDEVYDEVEEMKPQNTTPIETVVATVAKESTNQKPNFTKYDKNQKDQYRSKKKR